MLPVFQYQKGAIKTREKKGPGEKKSHFNTKKVRLKQHIWDAIKRKLRFNFNTKKVRLKHQTADKEPYRLLHFNTKKVRLKPGQRAVNALPQLPNFNTKKVRLKPGKMPAWASFPEAISIPKRCD